jgi:ADP-heptose:LPS heptosyltransferase
MKETIWVINRSERDFEKTDSELKRHVIIRSKVPYPLPARVAIRYAQNYETISICDNPQEYFKDRKFKQLIIRDAGIGDLLLLEPILRELHKTNKELSVLTQYPDVYLNHPNIKGNFEMKEKGILNIDLNMFDVYEDLRNYSETCVNRDKIHRTDCYNQIFKLNIDDKEPRLYFNENEKSTLKKNKDKIYIGLQCDASHIYRRYEKGKELIEYLIKQNKNYVIVLFGAEKYIDVKKHKQVIDLQEKTTIREAINIIRDLDFMIGVDSGLIHVALTLHVPTVAIMTIISPHLRLEYYTGKYEVLTKDEDCIGCGNKHMIKCIFGDKKIDPKFIPKCLDIEPKEIYDLLLKLKQTNKRKVYIESIKEEKPNLAVVHGNKLTMPIIVLNEEVNLPRFIENVVKNPYIGRVVAIDGGSDDKTVSILKKAGCEVYMHYYDKNYHDMQALQRNVSCSFVKDGERILIMDIDECFSPELKNYLPVLCEMTNPYALISRRTFDYYDDIGTPSKQIKDYPDWQPRFFIWQKKFKWVGSPHHNVYNCPEPIKIQKDIIHFEKEGKNRAGLENQWSDMEEKSKEVYG